MNYRMGLFGYLSHSALNGEGHLGNQGIMDDQVHHWGNAVAAAFGGDPSKVALGGQSAGASDTGQRDFAP